MKQPGSDKPQVGVNPGSKDKLGSKDKQVAQQQAQSGEGEQYGEGNYKATREYNAGVKQHMENHDVEREARDAAPRSEAEKQEMEQAERIGRGKSRGEGGSPDDAEDQRDLQKD